MKRWKSHIIEATPEARQFVRDYLETLTAEQKDAVLEKLEDSIIKCPQIGKDVVFINTALTGNKPKQLLQLSDVIQFGRSFVYDDGEKAVAITMDNYKSVDYRDWLTEIPEKYREIIQ